MDIEEIIIEYTDYVYKIVNNTVGNSLTLEDKEEIVSATFYLLWKNQRKIKTNLKSYLGTIARNCSYEKLRKKKIEFEYKDDVFITNEFRCQLNHIDVINDSLDLLDSNEQDLFVMYYFEGYKIDEIAKVLNTTKGNIKIRLYRIRKKIRREHE